MKREITLLFLVIKKVILFFFPFSHENKSYARKNIPPDHFILGPNDQKTIHFRLTITNCSIPLFERQIVLYLDVNLTGSSSRNPNILKAVHLVRFSRIKYN